MLEEAIDDADDLDVVAHAGDTGQQRAHAAHDHADPHPCLAGLVEPVDQFLVDQVVALEEDRGRLARARVEHLGVDQAQEGGAVGQRRDREVAELVTAIGVADEVEDVVDVLGDLLVRGEQREIGVEARGLLVEVAGPDMHVAAQLRALLAADQDQLGVHLQARYPEDHVHAGLGEALGPVDVGGLVEARAQLDDREHLLAVERRADQRIADMRVARHAVERDLDRAYRGIYRRRADQLLGIAERVIRVVQQYVALGDRGEDVRLPVDARHHQRADRPVLERARAEIGEFHEILGIVVTRAGQHVVVAAEAKALHHDVEHVVGHAPVVDQAHRIAELALLQAARERVDQALRDPLAELELGIARDLERECLGALDVENALEYLWQAGADHVVQNHDHLAVRLRRRRGHHDEARQPIRGDVHDGVAYRLVLQLDAHREVDGPVLELRRRGGIRDDDRRELGHHAGEEVLARELPLLRIELALVDEVDVVLAQLRQAGAVDAVEAHLQVADRVADVVEQLFPARFLATLRKGRQPPHLGVAHAVEFIEVVGEDAHEAHALDQRHFGILGFLQHARVEREPAQFLGVKRQGLVTGRHAGIRDREVGD